MKGLAGISVPRKLMLTTVLASAVALVLATAAFMAYDWISFEQGLVRRLSGQAELVAYNSASAVMFDDPESGTKTLSALHAERPVMAAALYAADRHRFVAYERDVGANVAPETLPPELERAGHHFQGNRLVVSRPVVLKGERVGTLLIVSDLSERLTRMRRYAAIAAGVFIASLLGGALVGRALQRSISRPILDLAEAAQAVSERNDLSVRAPGGGGDEIGALIATFNQMLKDLEGRREELRLAHAQAEQASRLKDEFLSTLSHELRTPLNAIVGWTHLLRAGLDRDGTARALDTIARNAMAQTQLIADILDMQRIAAGKLRLDLKPLVPAETIEAALDTVRPAARAKDIDLQAVLDPVAGPILADADRLQQVVWNLLANAVKFTPRGGRVRITLMSVDRHVEISVEDTGPGLEPAFIPHAFDRFRQADSSSTRRHGGLGLGLAIVRELTELHGGTVAAANRYLGVGAVFAVTLPRMSIDPARRAVCADEKQPSAVDDVVPLGEGPHLHGIRVLVVDDELDARELAAAVLGRHGADVAVASSAGEALDRLRTLQPHVVLCDIEMPEEDGYAFIRRVRALAPSEGGLTPAGALTAYASTAERMRALAAGFHMHIPKPVQPAELVQVVDSLARLTRLAGTRDV
jgi:signal transduction histidine kinase/ActR/RegA family two-component response regulator